MEKSLFNELPAEIRNAIYAYALFEANGADVNSQPALLKTCKQIQSEATSMYWAINGFKINIHEGTINHSLCQWLRKAGKRLQLVQNLTIHIEMPSIVAKPDASEEDAQDPCALGFLHLMHIVVCALSQWLEARGPTQNLVKS